MTTATDLILYGSMLPVMALLIMGGIAFKLHRDKTRDRFICFDFDGDRVWSKRLKVVDGFATFSNKHFSGVKIPVSSGLNYGNNTWTVDLRDGLPFKRNPEGVYEKGNGHVFDRATKSNTISEFVNQNDSMWSVLRQAMPYLMIVAVILLIAVLGILWQIYQTMGAPA